MAIALIGYGKMGQVLEHEILKRGLEAPLIIRSLADPNWTEITNCTAAIEFTKPEAAFQNIKKCFELKVPVVCGTTGWLHQLNEIKSLCTQHNGALVYASNFSIGVNLFFKLTQTFAHWMKSYPDYRVYIEEIHHTKKKDHPSGTALSLAELLMKELTQYNQVDPILEPLPNQPLQHAPKLPVLSFREGDVPGTHVVRFENEIDRIDLKHEAFGRSGFASGAIDSAIWIGGKKGVFTLNDMLGL